MNRIIAFALISFIGAFLLCACNKEDSKTVYNQLKTSIVYTSEEEYLEKYKLISQMSSEERKNYETANSYISFGRLCDEFYANMQPEAFKTQEEALKFIKANSQYLELIDEGNGEYTLETKLYGNVERYMCGTDRTFVVKDRAYKVLAEQTISCKLDNIQQLRNINEENVASFYGNKDFDFEKEEIEILAKDASVNNGTALEAKSTNGSNRTVTTAEIKRVGTGNLKATEVNVKVRPYKKTLGIWYFCIRSIFFDADFDVHIQQADRWLTVHYQQSAVVEANVYEYNPSISIMGYDAHFGRIFVEGDTPSTPAATISY